MDNYKFITAKEANDIIDSNKFDKEHVDYMLKGIGRSIMIGAEKGSREVSRKFIMTKLEKRNKYRKGNTSKVEEVLIESGYKVDIERDKVDRSRYHDDVESITFNITWEEDEWYGYHWWKKRS